MNKIREEMDDFIAFKSNGASGGNASEEVIAVLTKGTIHKACGQFSDIFDPPPPFVDHFTK